MFHRGIKYSTEGVKDSTEVSNIPRRGLKIRRRYQIFHPGDQIIHGGMKYSTEGVKHSTEV